MGSKADMLEQTLTLLVRPERERLVCLCYEALGYRLDKIRREEHADTQMVFQLDDVTSADPARILQCRSILEKIEAIDKQVTYYFLKLDCLVGMIGAACLGLSFAALHAGQHVFFTILLILGIFGCTVTLYLRPVFTRMGMKKYGGEEPVLIAELWSLLDLKDGGEEA